MGIAANDSQAIFEVVSVPTLDVSHSVSWEDTA